MQFTAIGTVWRCESGDEDEDGPHDDVCVVFIAERLPGHTGKVGTQGQNVYLELVSDHRLEVGKTYRVTARIESILPTQEDDDMRVEGELLEAQVIE